jgi:hypothetical protein
MSMLGSQGGSFVSPGQVSDIIGRVGGSYVITGSIRDFQKEMLGLLEAFTRQEPISVSGILITDFSDPSSTALLNFRMDEITNIMTGLNNVYYSLINLEKQLNA